MPGHRTEPRPPHAGWDARLSEPGSPVCAPDWLALREPADAAARSPELADRAAAHLGSGPAVIRDLGCGTGSMGRWLAPRLTGPQRWLLHDRDPVLLARAAAHPPAASSGVAVVVETVRGDLTDLGADDLAGTSLVTASALLDLLTADEVDTLAAACTAAGAAALLTLSVAGHVVLDPPDPLDAGFAAAFDAHQRRRVGGRPLLGPDAGAVAAHAFRARGATVLTRPSPWRLGAGDSGAGDSGAGDSGAGVGAGGVGVGDIGAGGVGVGVGVGAGGVGAGDIWVGDGALAEEWLRGWIAAAVAQRPELARVAPGYLARRLATPPHAEVGHVDVLALPGPPS